MFILQLTFNMFLFVFNLFSIALNRRNTIVTLMCIELMLLNINTNFIVFSVYLDDLYGQILTIYALKLNRDAATPTAATSIYAK